MLCYAVAMAIECKRPYLIARAAFVRLPRQKKKMAEMSAMNRKLVQTLAETISKQAEHCEYSVKTERPLCVFLC